MSLHKNLWVVDPFDFCYMNRQRSGSIKSDFTKYLVFSCQYHNISMSSLCKRTKDKEGAFDSTKFSDACVCRKFGLLRTTVTFYYGARQFLHRNLYSLTYNLVEESIDLVTLRILHIEIFIYRLLHRTFWRVCIRYTGDVINTQYSTSYFIGYSTWYYMRYT